MYQSDFEAFNKLIQDLCVAFNRPHTDDLVRVFWDALKNHPLPRIRSKCVAVQATAKKFPAPSDLVPAHDSKASGSREETVQERLKTWVVDRYWSELSKAQQSTPWSWWHRGNARTGEGSAITAVVIPEDGEQYPARKFTVEEMELDAAA